MSLRLKMFLLLEILRTRGVGLGFPDRLCMVRGLAQHFILEVIDEVISRLKRKEGNNDGSTSKRTVEPLKWTGKLRSPVDVFKSLFTGVSLERFFLSVSK